MSTTSSHTSHASGGGGGHKHADTPPGRGAPHTHGTDDLLDEIDGLLENNAEEFVRSYVQKGGQ